MPPSKKKITKTKTKSKTKELETKELETKEIETETTEASNNEPIVEENLMIEISEVPTTPTKTKRGRKPKAVSPSSETPKKRGRKPNKEKTTDSLVMKKVKKNKESYGLVTLSSKETSVRDLDNPILFLNLKPDDIEEVEKSFFEYDVSDYKPEISEPSPFDPDDENFHPLGGQPKTMIQNEELEIKEKMEKATKKEKMEDEKVEMDNFLATKPETSVRSEIPSTMIRYQKYTPMMKHYMETNRRENWPSSIDVNCLWGFHPFEGTPWGLPYKFENGKFHARPNFCSPGCASAYLFKNYDDDDVWEKYALLNMLFQKVVNDPNKNVIPAPDPECLSSNGGFLSLDEFINLAWQGNREFVIQMPPMVAITPTAKLQDSNRSYSEHMEPIYKKRLTEACDELRYKRNKPLTDRNNSLHHYFDSIRAGQV